MKRPLDIRAIIKLWRFDRGCHTNHAKLLLCKWALHQTMVFGSRAIHSSNYKRRWQIFSHSRYMSSLTVKFMTKTRLLEGSCLAYMTHFCKGQLILTTWYLHHTDRLLEDFLQFFDGFFGRFFDRFFERLFWQTFWKIFDRVFG